MARGAPPKPQRRLDPTQPDPPTCARPCSPLRGRKLLYSSVATPPAASPTASSGAGPSSRTATPGTPPRPNATPAARKATLPFELRHCATEGECSLVFAGSLENDRFVLHVDLESHPQTLELKVLQHGACVGPPGRVRSDPTGLFARSDDAPATCTTGVLTFGKQGLPQLDTEGFLAVSGGERVEVPGRRPRLRLAHSALTASGWLETPQGHTFPQLKVLVRKPAAPALRLLPLASLGEGFDNSPLRSARASPPALDDGEPGDENGYNPQAHACRAERHVLRDPLGNDAQHPTRLDMSLAAQAALAPGAFAAPEAAGEPGEVPAEACMAFG